MVVVRGTLEEYKEQLRPLFQRHWDEVGLAGADNTLKLNVNEDYYALLERNRQYLGIALKTDEGEVVGYLSMMIYRHYHHQDTTFATTDCFMIDRPYRGINGFKSILKMFELAEKILTQEFGVQYLQLGFSANNPLDVLAKRMGYVPSDIMYMKKLEVK